METPDRRNRLKDVDAVRFREENKPTKKKWLVFSIAFVALIAVALLAVFGYKYFQKKAPADAVYDANVLFTYTASADNSDIAYAPYKSGIVTATRNAVCFYNKDGEPEWELDTGVAQPILKVNENYIIIASGNAKDYMLIKNGKILVQATTTHNILNAGVAKNGAFFLVEDEPYYKGLLTVRDSDNKDMFVWHSGSSYIIDAAFNDRSSQIAVTTLTANVQTAAEADTSAYSSALHLFKLHEDTPYKTHEYDKTIATNVYYASGRYIVVTSDNVLGYSASNGESTWTYAVTPQALQRVDFNSGKLAVLSLAEDNTQTLHILKADGSVVGKVPGLKNAGKISLSKSIVAVGSGSTVSVYRTNGKAQYEVALPKTYSDICLFNNGQYLLGKNNMVLDILSSK